MKERVLARLRLADLRGVSLEGMAEQLGVSRRWLITLLSRDGTTFKELLNQVRRERLDTFEADDSHQAAAILGFARRNSLYRWCREQYGDTYRSLSSD